MSGMSLSVIDLCTYMNTCNGLDRGVCETRVRREKARWAPGGGGAGKGTGKQQEDTNSVLTVASEDSVLSLSQL